MRIGSHLLVLMCRHREPPLGSLSAKFYLEMAFKDRRNEKPSVVIFFFRRFSTSWTTGLSGCFAGLNARDVASGVKLSTSPIRARSDPASKTIGIVLVAASTESAGVELAENLGGLTINGSFGY